MKRSRSSDEPPVIRVVSNDAYLQEHGFRGRLGLVLFDLRHGRVRSAWHNAWRRVRP